MNDRRRFLHVLGASALVSACAVDTGSPSDFGGAGTGSGSGSGGGDGSGSDTATGTGTTGADGSSGSGLSGNFQVVAQVSELVTGKLKTVSGKSLLVGRDANGVYAMSSLCTHKECDMTIKGQQFSGGILCTCHSSRFSLNGAVLVGPASKPLQHYLVAIGPKGEVGVDTAQPVAADVRAAATSA